MAWEDRWGDKLGNYWDKGKEWLKGQTEEGGLVGDEAGTAARKDQGDKASAFADSAEGRFGAQGDRLDGQYDYMQRIAQGDESVSALQLKQAMGQNIAGQQAMAASARPGSGAMAARGAMQNAGRMGAGLAGQQAVAGIQERQSAQNSMNEMMLKQRQQELMAANQGRSNAVSAFNPNGPSGAEKQAGAISSALGYLGMGLG